MDVKIKNAPHQKSGLRIFTSNRLEILAGLLARSVCEPLASPFDKDIIVVQSRGMARWVSMELARINGICTNCYFPFPNTFLGYLREKIAPEVSESEIFDPQILTFSIMQHLSLCKTRPEYEAVERYLAMDDRQLKLLQLSEKIAELFDNYLVFRPEMILEWENQKEKLDAAQSWQADLWRNIVAAGTHLHCAHVHRHLMQKLDNSAKKEWNLPDRLSVFGISYLPPFHLNILRSLSKHIRVELFLMNPCQEYWGDITTRKEASRIRRSYRHQEVRDEDLHLEKGNRLMASMGRLGRDFFDMIAGMDGDLIENYRPADRQTMLASIQNDILRLEDPDGESVFDDDVSSGGGGTQAKTAMAKLEPSIQIHAGHSPMREIEILHNNLLAMFESSPDLMPKDILVMTPDIESYAPYIYAVFDIPSSENMRIPFSVADRNLMTENQIISAFMTFLDLKESRLETFSVMSLLEFPAVREKFGLREQDVAVLNTWVRDVNIRWGRDSESRHRLGFVDSSENTWMAGIQRMLLGYAMAGEDRMLFSNILPYDPIEGEVTACLGKFTHFVDCLFQFLDKFDTPRTLTEWGAAFQALVETMFHVDDDSGRQIHVLKQQLSRLQTIHEISGLKDTIEFETMKNWLYRRFQRKSFDSGFMSGGVTFCAMLPMRSIPFKVVCLIGLNNDNFPRVSRTIGFDLMARRPLPGDRSKRDDDKYLFLEAIVSAREKLYLSFVGQDIQDNSRITPSVLLSELLDYIHDRFGVSQEQMINYHPLQAFSPDYFKENAVMFNYSSENFRAAESLFREGKHHLLFAKKLCGPSQEWRRLDIETLIQFFKNPAKFLLQQRLGIFLEETKILPDEKENFRLESLDKYLVEQEILRYEMSGLDAKTLKPLLRAKGVLPYGNVGEYELKRLTPEIEQYVRQLAGYLDGNRPETIEWEAEVKDFLIYGTLRDLYDDRMIAHRYVNKNPKDMIRLWIYHLACCFRENKRQYRESVGLFRDSTLVYRYVKNSREVLSHLMEVFHEGMRGPMPFFPFTSYAYAEQKLERAKPGDAALRAAAKQWAKNFGRGEYDDPYISLCFSQFDTLDHNFEVLADSVFSPMLSHCRLYSGANSILKC